MRVKMWVLLEEGEMCVAVCQHIIVQGLVDSF